VLTTRFSLTKSETRPPAQHPAAQFVQRPARRWSRWVVEQHRRASSELHPTETGQQMPASLENNKRECS
jgi:hypothetical protein